jgi:hypothetical protein
MASKTGDAFSTRQKPFLVAEKITEIAIADLMPAGRSY